MDIIMYIDDELLKELHNLSMQQGSKLQDIIEEAISGYLERRGALNQSSEK